MRLISGSRRGAGGAKWAAQQRKPILPVSWKPRRDRQQGLNGSAAGEPPGTRTPNPLIKSQPAGGEVPRTRSASGLARSLACAKSQMGQLFDGHSCLNSTEIRRNAQDVFEIAAQLAEMPRNGPECIANELMTHLSTSLSTQDRHSRLPLSRSRLLP